jgi:predicted nuclease of restriction endonuclease-like (RecB) superfamily
MSENLPQNYNQTLDSIINRIELARLSSLKAVNKDRVLLNLYLGKTISERINEGGWGSLVIEKLSEDLQKQYPGVRGFSVRNLATMRFVYEEISTNEILQSVNA